jgi:hypothetical protein
VVKYTFKLVIVQAKRPLTGRKRSRRFTPPAGGQQAGASKGSGQFEKITAGEAIAGIGQHGFVHKIPYLSEFRIKQQETPPTRGVATIR